MSNTKKLFESIQSKLNETGTTKEDISKMVLDLGIIEIGTSDEHKENMNNGFDGYAYIEHNTLGEFYVAFNMKDYMPYTDGGSWNFLKNENKMTEEQEQFVSNNIETLKTIIDYVDYYGFIKLEPTQPNI